MLGFWYLHDIDNLILSRPLPGGAVKYLVPKQRLADIHPLLPIVFGAHIEFDNAKAEQPRHPPNHVNLAQTLSYLQKGSIDLLDATSVTSSCIEIVDMYTTPEMSQVRVAAFVVQPGYVVHQGKSIPFIERTSSEVLIVNKNSLNQQYPGWSERWDIARSMDMNHEETIEYVFSIRPELNDLLSTTKLLDSIGEI